MNSERSSRRGRIGSPGVRFLVCLLVLAGCNRKPEVVHTPPPAVVNPAFAASYQSIANEKLRGANADPDAAIKTLNEILQKEPNNGFTLYLKAAACAVKGDWDQVTRNLEAGNQAAYCVYYQSDTLPNRKSACFPLLQDLAKACVEAAPTLEVEKGYALLQGIRGMAKRITGAEPPSTTNPFIAVSLRDTADKALIARSAQAGKKDEADKARQQQAADTAWKLVVIKEVGPLLSTNKIMAKYGITPQEIDAMSTNRPLTPETRQKLEVMANEMEDAIKPVIEKLLQSMPD